MASHASTTEGDRLLLKGLHRSRIWGIYGRRRPDAPACAATDDSRKRLAYMKSRKESAVVYVLVENDGK